MRYRTAQAFRAALDQRLRNEAAASGVSLMRLRKRVAFERLLARLAAAGPGRWVLTGAFALDLRLGLRSRPTKDVDIARPDDPEAATADLAAASVVDLGDYFSFDVRRAPAGFGPGGFRALRYSVASELAGRPFELLAIDVALGETAPIEPDRLRAPDVLAFAGIEPPEVPVVALEVHVAEKVHAYTATYGAQGVESTRAKDLVDLVLIGDLVTLDGRRLSEALKATFDLRARQPLPAALPPPPPSWAVPYARLAREVGLPVGLAAAHTEAAALVDPVLGGGCASRWDPRAKGWRPVGPSRESRPT